MKRLALWLLVAILAAYPQLEARSDDDFIARMEAEHSGDAPVASPAARAEPAAPIGAREVVYAELDGKMISGYLAQPTEGSELPAILLIHEWWGLNDNIRAVARRFAGEGYLALAVDLYEGEVADDRKEAGRLARATRDRAGRAEENLRQAWRYLREEQGAPRIGVIGWCFGGGWSLRAALMLSDGIDATAIYYGRLVTEHEALEPLISPVLGIFGGLDDGIPPSRVRQFESVLQDLGKTASIHIYDDADHAFANPSGTRYNAAAAEDAWQKTLAFFAEHLK